MVLIPSISKTLLWIILGLSGLINSAAGQEEQQRLYNVNLVLARGNLV